MKTSFVIPFKNEEEYAEKTIHLLHSSFSSAGICFELIAVDDSVDRTWEILLNLKSTYRELVVIKGDSPSGYGRALRKGFANTTGDIVIPFNGDLSDSPDDALAYIESIEAGHDMVFGTRFHRRRVWADGFLLKQFVSRVGNRLLGWLFGTSCDDLTNSFKAYRKRVLDTVHPSEDGYQISMEIALKGIRQGFHYKTIPVDWQEREYGSSKMSMARAIPRFLITAIKIRLDR